MSRRSSILAFLLFAALGLSARAADLPYTPGEPVRGTFESFALGFLLSFSYQGVKIDPEQKRYLKYDRFAWFRIGQWKPMSPPAYVTIVRINLSSHRNLPSPLALPDDRKGAKSYKVNLVVEGDERYISICRGPLEGMTAEALRLGRHLGIRVLDFSTHEKKWIL